MFDGSPFDGSRSVREVSLPDFVLAFASYGSERLYLIDHELAGCTDADFRFTVSRAFVDGSVLDDRIEDFEADPPCWYALRVAPRAVVVTRDEAEGRVLFAAEAERLRLTP